MAWLGAMLDASAMQTACRMSLCSLACRPFNFSGFRAEEDELGGLGLAP